MAIKYLTDKQSDGWSVGQDADEKVSFHGATPVDQYAAIADVDDTAATSSTPFGFSEAQANGLVTQVNLILAALREKGLIASA